MKRWIKGATNTAGIPAKPVFGADEEDGFPTLDDKISEAKSDFELLMDQVEYEDNAAALETAEAIQDTIGEFIESVAADIAAGGEE